MKNSLLMLLFLLGLSCQVFGQTPAKGFEGSWQGTLEAGGTEASPGPDRDEIGRGRLRR